MEFLIEKLILCRFDAGLMYQYSFTVYKHLKLNMQGTFSGVKAFYNNNGKQKHSVDNDIIFCFTF